MLIENIDFRHFPINSINRTIYYKKYIYNVNSLINKPSRIYSFLDRMPDWIPPQDQLINDEELIQPLNIDFRQFSINSKNHTIYYKKYIQNINNMIVKPRKIYSFFDQKPRRIILPSNILQSDVLLPPPYSELPLNESTLSLPPSYYDLPPEYSILQ